MNLSVSGLFPGGILTHFLLGEYRERVIVRQLILSQMSVYLTTAVLGLGELKLYL